MTKPLAQDLRYLVPKGRAEAEIIVRGSVFVGTVGRAESVEEAKAFIEQVRQEHPDANHSAFAYHINGKPQPDIGTSDDGEPGGTAGRPMLAILEGRNLREVVAVGTRYFGGTELGMGGLVRAYSRCVRAALEELPIVEMIYHQLASITIDYGIYDSFIYMLPQYKVLIQEKSFGERAELTLSVPFDQGATVSDLVRDLTNGDIVLTTVWRGGHYVEHSM
jgi:uncharacterized YigZ family protein